MSKEHFKLYTPYDPLTTLQKSRVVRFLEDHLDQFGDDPKSIERAIDYALEKPPGKGGYLVVCTDDREVVGTVVVNRTGMKGYIPENVLVYIAVHRDYRGKGLGKKLMKNTIKVSEGNIALHVEPDNPARYLYENVGFENKYLEMRLDKSKAKRLEKEAVTSTRSSEGP